jgi:hypothetical protein
MKLTNIFNLYFLLLNIYLVYIDNCNCFFLTKDEIDKDKVISSFKNIQPPLLSDNKKDSNINNNGNYIQ